MHERTEIIKLPNFNIKYLVMFEKCFTTVYCTTKQADVLNLYILKLQWKPLNVTFIFRPYS